MLLELILYGSISGIFSFMCSYNITTEILRYNTPNINIMYSQHLPVSKKDSRVKFNENITVLMIPSRSYLENHKINDLWYKKDDYNQFKQDILNSKDKAV